LRPTSVNSNPFSGHQKALKGTRQPKTAPANAGPDRVKAAVVAAPVVVRAPVAPSVPVTVAAAKPPVVPVVAPATCCPAHTPRREARGLDGIFNHGTRALTRTEAVSALKALGFGKTAAYKALSMDGSFAPWLQFASNGIITLKEPSKSTESFHF